MSVSKRVRFDVFKRDRFTCTYCGRKPPDVMLECDHVHPKCEGGTDDPANLTTSCADCNRGKSGKPLGSVVPALDEMAVLEGMQEALERAYALRKATVAAEAQAAAEEEAVDTVVRWYGDLLGDCQHIEDATLKRFVRSLGLDEVRDAIEVTQSASSWKNLTGWREWKYFCGVCWTKIRDRERNRDDDA